MYKKLLTVLLPVIGEGLLFFSTSIYPLVLQGSQSLTQHLSPQASHQHRRGDVGRSENIPLAGATLVLFPALPLTHW